MAVDLAASAVAVWGAGIGLMALGAFVAFHTPSTRTSVAFGLFAILWGARPVVLAMTPEPQTDIELLVASALQILAVPPLLYFATHFPRPLSRADGPAVLLAVALAATIAGGTTLSMLLEVRGLSMLRRLELVSQLAIVVPQWALLVLLARRASAEPDAALLRQYVIVSFGLMLFPNLVVGDDYANPIFFASCMLGPTAITVAWIANARAGVLPAASRNLAILSLALPAVMMVRQAFYEDAVSGRFLGAAALVLLVVVLAYAVLRLGMFGLDVKVRWTLRQSTIGAMFVAVFVVASELAQTLVSDTAGPYLGVFAAGTLVFAMAPLQRVAERIATSAVPLAADASSAVTERTEAYRSAVAMALADGVLTRDEERHLAKLATALRLGHEEALTIREGVERARTPS